MIDLGTMLERNRQEKCAAQRERYRQIVVAVADRVAKQPLSTNESYASRLDAEEVAELMRIFDDLRKSPTSFENDVAGVAAVRQARRHLDDTQAALAKTRPVEEIVSDLAIERMVEDFVMDAARLPVTALEAAERRRRSAEGAVESADRAMRSSVGMLSDLMEGWNERT